MISPAAVVAAFLSYSVLLFLAARHAERSARSGRNLADHPVIYSLTLAVFCTSWTYYGSVGKTATSGFLFLTVYLGPTATVVAWWIVLRKLVRIKEMQHVTSIADLISARYDRSQAVAAVATVTALIGITPYIALQLKSLESTFHVLTGGQGGERLLTLFGIGMVVLLAFFTVYFGARRLDPTERHHGIMTALAVESLVKLVAFLAVGIFVTYGLFRGFGDVLGRATAAGILSDPLPAQGGSSPYILWTTYMTLSGAAILFLPRQFHVAVVENSDERHILTAMWLFPLYMLLINLFVIPIAAGGLLRGLPASDGDTFALTLPLDAGNRWLAMVVFLGGFSAATGMAIVSTMTVSTMVTNHLLAPLAGGIPALGFIRRNLLRCRWGAIVAVLILGSAFERMMGDTLMLVNMGILSFAAVFQFAPALLGGLFWTRGNRVGALAGMTGGFLAWAYTLLLPAFVRGGYLPATILADGPFGLAWLKPESLFGISVLDPLSHGVYWSLAVNLGLYVAGSVLVDQSTEERRIAEEFVDVLVPGQESDAPYGGRKADIDLAAKSTLVREILGDYFPDWRAAEIVGRCLKELGFPAGAKVSVVELVQFYGLAETYLAGATGSAGAHRAFQRADLLTPAERAALSRAYAGILTDMNLSPLQLRMKVDYYREREALLTRTSRELEEKVRERDLEIRERRKAVETLRRSEERQRLLLEASPAPIASFDEEERVTYVNPAFTQVFGWAREELLGKRLDFLVPEDAREETREAYARLLLEGKLIDFETRRIARGGALLDVLVSASTLADAEDRFTGTIAFLRDVTDRKQAEKMFHRLAAAVEQAVEMIVISDLEGKIQYVNPAFHRVLGNGTETPTDARELADRVQSPGAVADLRDKVLSGECWKGSLTVLRGDGTSMETECTASPVRDKAGRVVNYVLVCRDVTTERMIEEHLRQSQKLDAIGTLAGGIAHDFNNILQPLLGYAELVKKFASKDPRLVAGYVENILSGGMRARDLVSQILAFARHTEHKREPVRLAPLVRDTVQFLRASIPTSIDIRQVIRTKDAGTLADPSQLAQVLVNLCTNAAQAMKKDGGTLTIRISDVEVNEGMAARYPGLRPGPFVRIDVADTGVGMSPDVMARIFEPFFTTRPKGEGTGLGLSVVHGIVEDHGGIVTVESREGRGSTFGVYLPRVEIAAEAEKAGEAPVPQGAESVLFVDDEPMIRELAAESLALLGYRVTTAFNGTDALEKFRAGGVFQIVVTDYTMPDMNGIALSGKILEMRPDMPIILCSGFMPSLGPAGVREHGIRRFLLKPITLKELGAAIHACLHEHDREGEGEAAG